MSDLDDDSEKYDVLLDMGIRPIDQRSAERGAAWLYEELIPYDTFGVLLGDTGVGKSMVAVDLAVAVATGTSFASYEFNDGRSSAYATQARPLKGRAVLYIHGEGGASLDARLTAAYESRGYAYTNSRQPAFEDQGIHKLPLRTWELMCTSEGPTSLRAKVEEFLRKGCEWELNWKMGSPLGLIVVDTWTATVGLTNENDNSVTQDRVNSLKQLAKTTGSTVLVVAHTKKGTDEMRGATSVVNAADFVLRIEKKKSNADKLSLVHQKARHGPTQATRYFRLSPIDERSWSGDGVPPPVVDWLVEDEAPRLQLPARTMRVDTIKGSSAAQHNESDDKSSLDVYMEAVRLAVLGQGLSGADGFTGAVPLVIRARFDSMYGRNPEANRKAFERAHVRAINEGRVAVSTVDGGRQLVRAVE